MLKCAVEYDELKCNITLELKCNTVELKCNYKTRFARFARHKEIRKEMGKLMKIQTDIFIQTQ